MLKRFKYLLPLVLVVVTATSAAAQATLYVNAATGDDAVTKAANSASTPWRTIGRAAWGSVDRNAQNASQGAAEGDTVMISGGTYSTTVAVNSRWSVVYNPVNQGTATRPITFRCAGICVLGAPNANAPIFGSDGRNYISWYANASQGHQWRINAYGRQGGSASATEVNTTPDTGPVVCHATTGCLIEGAAIDGGLQTDYTDNWNAIRLENCTSCTVRNNNIRNFRNLDNTMNGTGVTLYGSPNALVESNYVTNVGSAIIFKDHGSTLPQNGIQVRFNKFEGADRCFVTTLTSEGRNYVYQNLCLNGGIGLHVTGGGFSNEWYFNNTFVNLSSSGLYIASPAGTGGRFWNNIVYNAMDMVYINGTMPQEAILDLEHNIYSTFTTFYVGTDGNRTFTNYKSAYPSQDQAAPASVTNNPLFVNLSGGDFRLCIGAGVPAATCTAASPAIGLGIDVYDLDRDGNTTETVPAGAYITNSESFGPVLSGGSAPTTAPTNLRVVGGQ